MLSKKHGQGGMGMMMPLLIIFLIVALMMCQKDKKKHEQPKQPQQPQLLSTPQGNVSNACLDDGFYACDQCAGEVLDLPAGTNKVCCDMPCEGCPEDIPPPCINGTLMPLQNEQGCETWKCVEGNQSLSCAFQKGFGCKDTENCPDKQWIVARDTQRCCKILCKVRVQTEVMYPDLGKVVIERFGAGKFGVYYGTDVSLGSIVLGKATYADAMPKGSNVYEFTANKKQYAFKIVKETETEITAEIAQPFLLAPGQDAKAYLVEKYNPGICFGMPRVVTEEERKAVMMPDSVAYVKQRFGVTSDQEIYTKIVQLRGITIHGDAFAFRDGKCCTIRTYEGKIKIDGSTIQDEVIKQDVQNVPC